MCRVHSFYFTDEQGIRLYAEQWHPSMKAVKGIVQIAHGMREYTGYYSEFCKVLAEAGYGTVIHDARGHGRTAGKPYSEEFIKNSGDTGENGVNRMVDDLAQLTDYIRRQNPGVPVFLLGHSMGSVLSRLYVSRYGERIDGLIYSGTTGPADAKRSSLLLKTAEQESHKFGRHATAIETPKLLFGHFNDRFEPIKTGYEYMSRDETMVKEANLSPYAAISYRCGFYVDFIRAMREMDLPEHVEQIPKNLPIFSVSGDMDPFGDYGEGVRSLFALYHAHGLTNASITVYKGGRHEMLRETNRREVFVDIIDWLDAVNHSNCKQISHSI